ncbi:MAG: DUF4333 domain-containing protein [Acidimicrobiia bacterium]
MARHRGLGYLTALVCVPTLGLAACGSSGPGTKALNIEGARQRILQLAHQEYSDDAAVGAVRCPAVVQIKKDNNFSCTVNLSGMPLRIIVKQTDNQGSVKFQQAQSVLVPKKMGDVVVTYGAQQGTPVSSVSCGRTPVIIEGPGKKVTCAVTFADGSTGVATFRVNDVLGNTPLVSLARTEP